MKKFLLGAWFGGLLVLGVGYLIVRRSERTVERAVRDIAE